MLLFVYTDVMRICSIITVCINTGVVDGVIYVAVSADTCCG